MKKLTSWFFRAFEKQVINGAAILVNCAGSKMALQYASNNQKNGLGNQFGIHLNFSEGKSILPANALPTLTDDDGNFYSWQKFAIRTVLGLTKKEEIINEARTQIDRYQKTARVDFINSHHHLHLLPAISGDIVELARRYQINKIRCPQKKWLSLEYQHSVKAFIIQIMGKFSKIEENNSLATYLADLDWVGVNDDKLKSLFQKLPPNCEIICHPQPEPSTLLWLIENKNRI